MVAMVMRLTASYGTKDRLCYIEPAAGARVRRHVPVSAWEGRGLDSPARPLAPHGGAATRGRRYACHPERQKRGVSPGGPAPQETNVAAPTQGAPGVWGVETLTRVLRAGGGRGGLSWPQGGHGVRPHWVRAQGTQRGAQPRTTAGGRRCHPVGGVFPPQSSDNFSQTRDAC